MPDFTSRLLIYGGTIPEPATVAQWLGRDVSKDPDVLIVTDEKSIKIAHIRELQLSLQVKPLTPEGRVVIITPGQIVTAPAQQALLKLLEEPPPSTQMVITATTRQALLPTILSRCVVEYVTRAGEESEEEHTEGLIEQLVQLSSTKDKIEFIQSLPSKREDLLAVLLEELSRPVAYNSETLRLRQGLVEAVTALRSNVNPSLCLEKWVL